ncbi:MAG: nitroreductase family protein [Alphaproteobacteria bacterium]|jgi:nitroreductase|nr:nitroreductase family protein [Alphaproteobacteria bacterium]
MSEAVSDPAAEALTSETIELLRARVSVRKYQDRPVGDDLVEAILKAAFRAPTSSNIQSYSVVVVRDADTLRQLSVISGNQAHIVEAPVFLAFCADLTRIEFALRKNGHDIDDNNLEIGLVSSIDAALVGMSADLAADSLGLKTVMIGAIRNDAAATARILGLPPRVYCVYGMCLGWPAEAPRQKPRMAYDSMVHYEQYGEQRGAADLAATVDTYDAALARHYPSIGKPTTPDSWSHDMDVKFHPQLRDNLRTELRERGFDFR